MQNFTLNLEELSQAPVLVKFEGTTIGVLLSIDNFEQLVEAEETLEDIRAIEQSMKDPGPNIPWDVVKRDLGLS